MPKNLYKPVLAALLSFSQPTIIVSPFSQLSTFTMANFVVERGVPLRAADTRTATFHRASRVASRLAEAYATSSHKGLEVSEHRPYHSSQNSFKFA